MTKPALKPAFVSDTARVAAQMDRAEAACKERERQARRDAAAARKQKKARAKAARQEKARETEAKKLERQLRYTAARKADKARLIRIKKRKQAERRQRRQAAAILHRELAKKMPNRVVNGDLDGNNWLHYQLKPFGNKPYRPQVPQHTRATEEIERKFDGRRPFWVEQMTQLVARYEWADGVSHTDINLHTIEDLRRLEIEDHICDVAPLVAITPGDEMRPVIECEQDFWVEVLSVIKPNRGNILPMIRATAPVVSSKDYARDGLSAPIGAAEWQREGVATLTGVGGPLLDDMKPVTRRVNGLDMPTAGSTVLF